ncbi:MAG: 16S rRNA pseudouridine(516) synthase, partial [Oscillospiraceae bacterium]|nr:16S rRNA pseudouridine(516) synthase [Oscillospiraceae bacterium]
MAQTRLDKLLSDRTPHSRAEIKKLLRAGSVLVDGTAERDGSRKVDPDVQSISCLGKPLRQSEHVYYLLNKPMNVV